MTDDLLSAALAEIRERERKATPGPWKVDVEHGYDMDGDPWRLPSVTGPDGKDVILDDPVKDLKFAAGARSDVPRLLAALDAALEHHQPRQLYEMTEDYRGNPKCGHDPDKDWDQHFEGDDGLWYCRDKPTVKVCGTCSDEGDRDLYAAWPCPTYAAILAALTGKEAHGDPQAAR